MLEPPCKEEGACNGCQGMRRGGFSRSATWRNQMIEDGHFEAGRVDPIGYLELLLTEKRKSIKKGIWGRLGRVENTWTPCGAT